MQDIKQLLYDYPHINERIINLSENLRVAIEAGLNADGCLKAANMSDAPVSSGTSDRTYNAVEDLFEHLEEISAELAIYAQNIKNDMHWLIEDKQRLDKALLGLNRVEYVIIADRYWTVPAVKWEKIAGKLHYDRVWIWHLHGLVLDKLRAEMQKK